MELSNNVSSNYLDSTFLTPNLADPSLTNSFGATKQSVQVSRTHFAPSISLPRLETRAIPSQTSRVNPYYHWSSESHEATSDTSLYTPSGDAQLSASKLSPLCVTDTSSPSSASRYETGLDRFYGILDRTSTMESQNEVYGAPSSSNGYARPHQNTPSTIPDDYLGNMVSRSPSICRYGLRPSVHLDEPGSNQGGFETSSYSGPLDQSKYRKFISFHKLPLDDK